MIVISPPVGGGGGGCLMKTGTYVGNAVDSRNIDIGVDLASMSYVYIIIKDVTGALALHRIEYEQGDTTMFFTGTWDLANLIQGLTATGFQIGGGARVNVNDELYRYIVFWMP